MSDYTVMVKEQAKVFLGGPPLVKMATGEESDDESLGGAEMHARTSGLADYLAEDERDAIRIGRRIVARLNWRKAARVGSDVPGDSAADVRRYAEPDADPDGLLDLIPTDLKEPFDPREVIARICDGSRPSNGVGVRRVQAALRLVAGDRLGADPRPPDRHPRQRPGRAVLRGGAEGHAVHPARQPGRLPLLFLHNTTGYMVGKEYEQGGIIKHGAMMINAVSNTTVPHLSIDHGRVVRRRQLRHERPRLRPALPVHLALARSPR